MPRFICAIALVLGAALTAGSTPLHACSCAPPSAPCQSEWLADAVFVGEAIAIEQLTEPEMWGSRRVTFSVGEAFKGVQGRFVDVVTGSGGGDCGFNFTEGRTYLVFAHRHPTKGKLTTGICSRTSLASGAGDELKLLRGPARPLTGPALLNGRVMRSEYETFRTPRLNVPFSDARVRLVGQAGSFETRTSSDGRYEFRVPTGRYRLIVETGEQFYSAPDAAAGLEVRLVDAAPCAPIEIQIRSNGRVRGRLLDSTGRPIPFLSLDIADRERVESPGTISDVGRTMTDADGRFEFERLSAGDYVIGLTLTRYPRRRDGDFAVRFGSDAAFQVGLEANIDAGAIRLPGDVRVRQVTGWVLDEASVPIAGVEVRVVTPGKEPGVSSEPVVTDSHGRFVISALAGRAHELVAEDRTAAGDRRMYRTARSPTFDTAVESGPFTLIVKAR